VPINNKFINKHQKIKPFSEEEISRVLKKTRLGTNLHCHFEGILNSSDLEHIAERLGKISNFKTSTWVLIEKIMNGENESLNGFLNRLSGRWIRLLLIKAVLKGHHTFDTAFPYFVKSVLEKIYNEGVGMLELMVSVMTLTNEGDFFLVPIKEDFIPEEIQLINLWNQQVKSWQRVRSPEIKTLSVQHCFKLFNKIIEEDKRYCYSGQKKANTFQMEIGLKFMIRREKDKRYSNYSETLAMEVNKIKDLYNNNLIVGVDIAGDECNMKTYLDDYSVFLKKLNELEIPFTVHAGEIPENDTKLKKLAYANLKDSVLLSPKRIGHAVRLFDKNLKMMVLLRKVLKKKIFIEVNVSSNILTKTVDNAEVHPILLAMKGKHPLFKKNRELLDRLYELILVCDDDPVTGKSKNSIAHELALTTFFTGNLGFSTSLELLQHLNDNARRAKFVYKKYQENSW